MKNLVHVLAILCVLNHRKIYQQLTVTLKVHVIRYVHARLLHMSDMTVRAVGTCMHSLIPTGAKSGNSFGVMVEL